MNDNHKLDIAYIAGLFDADGSVSYKKYPKKRKGVKKDYMTWNIRLEISMTDKNVIELVHETLMVGTVHKRPPGKGQLGKKMQYRWRCGYRDALYVCKLLWPYAIVKLHKIEQIIDHYEPDIQELGDNVVDLALERENRQP
jgi:stalled ribosome alternative rescue factor ArfA